MSIYPRVAGRLLRPPPGLLAGATRVMAARGRVAELTPLERVLVAVHHREPDRVPVFPFVLGGSRRLTGISYPELGREPAKTAEAYLAATEIIGGDALVSFIDLSVEAADFGQAMVYPEDTTAHPDYARPRIASAADYRRLDVFDPARSPRMGAVVELARILSRRARLRYPVLGFLFGPLGVLGMMRGAGRLFVDLLEHPDEVRAGLETVTEVLVRFARAQCDAGVDAMMLDTLYAAESGVSRAMWKELEGPHVRRIADEIRHCGALVAVHNCGRGPYFDVQIETMRPSLISFAHLPDDCPTAADLARRYGRQVALAGYVPTDALLVESPRRVMEIAREQIDVLGRGGGFVLAPGCEYPPNHEIAGALALVRAAEIHGRYPLARRAADAAV